MQKWSVYLAAVLLASLSTFAEARFSELDISCLEGSDEELDRAIHEHDKHMDKLYFKFVTGWYGQSTGPNYSSAKRVDVVNYLEALNSRAPGVLFYAFDRKNGLLCAWLILRDKSVVFHSVGITEEKLYSLRPRLLDAFGVNRMKTNRAPRRRGLTIEEPRAYPEREREMAVEIVSQLLLTKPIIQALLAENVDSLIIVPSADLGAIPFSALHVEEKELVDVMSVFVAPGFFSFKKELRHWAPKFDNPIVVGVSDVNDPEWDIALLPGAKSEAQYVASLFGVEPLLDKDATKANVLGLLRNNADTGLIYFATHGISDVKNPRHGSLLFLRVEGPGRNDGPHLHAAEIDALKFQNSPLVVLSACQTGLGKHFDVGTIGMSRAWHRSGASSVVMSLWNLDDDSTQRLMSIFIENATKIPADKALQKAMWHFRDERRKGASTNAGQASWAGFNIFGLPEN